MKVSKELQEQARTLRYHQRRALSRLAGVEPSQQGIGPQTAKHLLDAGLATYRVNGTRSLVLTEAGVQLHKVLEQLGWLPPD